MNNDQREEEIENVLQSLDQEAEQEAAIKEGGTSLFDDAPPPEKIRERVREFDDIQKHIVRLEHWMPIARKLRISKGKGLKILTLPGKHRLEIELYHKEGLIAEYYSGSGRKTLDCVGFEALPDTYGLLKCMSPPLAGLRNECLIETINDPEAEYHDWLISFFPFDIINLDLTVNLVTRREGPYGPVLEAIRECLRLQAGLQNEWALMLTFRAGVDDTDPEAIKDLKEEFDENLKHPQLKEACHKRFNVTSADALFEQDSEEALGHFAAKWVVDQAHHFDWKVSRIDHLCYDREPKGYDRYSIRKLVFMLKHKSLPKYQIPKKPLQVAKWHLDDLERLIGKAKVVNIDEKVKMYEEKRPQHIEEIQREIDELKLGVMTLPGNTTTANS